MNSASLPTVEDLGTRLDRLESRIAIGDLLADYCGGCDNADLARFAAIWHDDARFAVGAPFGEPVGPSEICEVLLGMRRVYPEIRHWVSNVMIRLEDADVAACSSDALCEAINRRGEHVLIAASYIDRCERRAGAWKIAVREITLHHSRTLSGAGTTEPTLLKGAR